MAIEIDPKILQCVIDKYKDSHLPLSTDDVEQIIREEKTLHREVISEHRWWNVEFRVTYINGMLIGYEDGMSTGDSNADELGFIFDPGTICEVEEKKEMVMVTTYVRK